MATNPGKIFEQDLMNSFNKKKVFTYRFKDSPASFQKASSKVRFTANNICDFMVAARETTFLELKSTLLASMPFKNISERQVEQMNKVSQFSNVKAYFIFNFRDFEKTYAIEASKVHDYYHNSTGKSFPIEWAKANGMLIEQKKKRVRYIYDVEKLLA